MSRFEEAHAVVLRYFYKYSLNRPSQKHEVNRNLYLYLRYSDLLSFVNRIAALDYESCVKLSRLEPINPIISLKYRWLVRDNRRGYI